jgi:hypothetical protein
MTRLLDVLVVRGANEKEGGTCWDVFGSSSFVVFLVKVIT